MAKAFQSWITHVVGVLALTLLVACTKEDQSFDPQIVTGELVNGIYVVESTPVKTKFRIEIGEPAIFHSSKTLGWTNVSKNGVVEFEQEFVGVVWVEVEKNGSSARTNLPVYVAQNGTLAKEVVRNLVEHRDKSLIFVARHAYATVGEDIFDNNIKDWWKSCDPSLARQIDEYGVGQSKLIGNGIKALGANVKKALSSEFCRAYQTIIATELPISITKSSILNLGLEAVANPQDVVEIWPEVVQLLENQEISNEMLMVVAHCNLFDKNPHSDQIGWSRLPGDGFLMSKNQNGKVDFIGPVPNSLWKAFLHLENK